MKPLIVIVGETASGKSSLSLTLAQQFGGEIVNADSWNVYREMDIGTAKPGRKERELVSHHLIDIINPDDDYTAALFQKDANLAVADIHSRGKLPIMVGGNGLYVDSVLFNYSFLPPSGSVPRDELNNLTIEALLELISDRGYDVAGIDTRNKRRLVRLIENEGKRPTRSEIRSNTLVLGVTRSRTEIRKRMEKRVEIMFREGLRKEVDELVSKYGWRYESMKGIGYREFKDYYDGKFSMTQTKHRIVSSTLKLAKRQRTWFKRNQHIVWIASEVEAMERVENFLNNKS